MKKYLLWILSLGLILSEIILKLKPEFGFIVYSVLIGGCLIALAEHEKLDDYGKLIIIFMILPIVRVSELFIGFNFFVRSFVVYYILGFLVVFYGLKFKIDPGYSKKYLWYIPLVVILGGILGILGNVFDFTHYSGWLFLLPIIAFSEEVLFRGLIQNLINKEYGVVYAIIISSIIYCVFSLYSFPMLFVVFAFSLVSGIIYYFSKNIYLSMIFNLVFHLFILVF